jgi:hypothetical protein
VHYIGFAGNNPSNFLVLGWYKGCSIIPSVESLMLGQHEGELSHDFEEMYPTICAGLSVVVMPFRRDKTRSNLIILGGKSNGNQVC